MNRVMISVMAVSAAFVVSNANGAQYSWRQDDGLLALENGTQVVWQLNFKKAEGKPYFHPLNLADGTTITELRPADHPWHRGLWWSWKYINHINYWEENKKTGLCDGRTDLAAAKVEVGSNFSARVEMDLNYHLPDKGPLLTEKRLLAVGEPDEKGNYRIDWTSTFTAGTEDLTFDRTPPKNFSGGYAGLSCRMTKAIQKWTYTGSDGTTGATNIYGKTEKWVDFSHGGGITIFDHPSNLRHPTAWYPNGMPFFSPAIVFHEPYTLAAGKSMTLRYRVLVHSSAVDKDGLEVEWKKCAGE